MTENAIVPDDPPADLLDALRAMASAGFGTVVGGRPLSGIGLVRVGRDRAALADVLDRLYRDQFTSLVGYAMRRLSDRAVAEDVVQRAFEKVWRRSPDPDELDNPAAYVATATRNEINRELRRIVVERAHRLAGAAAGDDCPAAIDVSVQIGERLAVRDALATLSAREREAVVLRLQWELSIEETATMMGVSPGAVKGYTHHGVRKLRQRITR